MDRDGDDVSAADHEREARALGGLIRNFERLKQLDSEKAGKSSGSRLQNKESGDGADDQDAFRRSVAERIVRLRERLCTED